MGSRSVGAGAVGLALVLGLAAACPLPVAGQAGCGNVAIRSPFAGDVVRGAVPVLGSARIEGFGFYKVEWAAANDPEDWKAVSSTYGSPVEHGQLDLWDTSRLPDGTYRLRLVVVDQSGQEPCRRVAENLRVANDVVETGLDDDTAPGTRPGAGLEAEAALGASSVITPTVALRPAGPNEVPPTTTSPATRSDSGATPSAAAPEPGAEAALAVAPSEDFPLELPRPIEEEAAGPAGPTQAPLALDALDPSGWIAALGLSQLPTAFAGGALAALLVALFGLVIVGLRRPK